MKIYVASSWRNTYYPSVVSALRDAGHDVYDFRSPPSDDPGFHWTDIDLHAMEWSPSNYQEGLHHPKAERQFKNDIEAMKSCDACVLVLPCGRSAHTEAGWFAGTDKIVIAYVPEPVEPELMYKLFSDVCTSMHELIDRLAIIQDKLYKAKYNVERQIANILLQETLLKPIRKPTSIFLLINNNPRRFVKKLRVGTPPELEIMDFAWQLLDYKTFTIAESKLRELSYDLILTALEDIVKREGTLEFQYDDENSVEPWLRHFTLTPKTQKFDKGKFTRKANLFAKSNGKKKPTFVCYWYGSCIYKIDNSQYLVVNDSEVRLASKEENQTLTTALQETNFPWGKVLYETHEANVLNRDHKHSQYDTSIYRASFGGGYDSPVKMEILYEFLEQAELLHKHIEFFPDACYLTGGECEGQCDGWSYHPVLVDSKNKAS